MGVIGKPLKKRRNKKANASKRKSDGRQGDFNLVPESNEQEIPRAVRDIMAWKSAGGEKAVKKRKRKSKTEIEYGETLNGMTEPIKPPINFKRKSKESKSSFEKRIERETIEIIQKSKFENKFGGKLIGGKKGKFVKNEKEISEKKKRRLLKLAEKKNERKEAKKQRRLERLT